MTARSFLAPISCFLTIALTTAVSASQVATGPGGMVVAATREAAEAGARILAEGGNATDSAVTVGFVLAVTYPRAGNLGGGGFMLVHDAKGPTQAIDYREVAPARAGRDLYRDAPADASLVGPLASGVPGTVAGLAKALELHGSGRFTWAQLIEPARKLAADGFPLSEDMAWDLSSNTAILGSNPESRRIYLNDGHPFAAGERFRQPDLAATLERLQTQGPREFYEGRTAELLVAEMQSGGGIITAEDLRDYTVQLRDPIKTTYRGYTVLSMPPPSSGGIVLAQMLGMLEERDVAGLTPGGVDEIHLLVEVMRRGFRDRASLIADPAFHEVPVPAMLDRDYLRQRMADFDPTHATPSLSLASVWPAGATPPAFKESMQTTHYSIVDADGNAVSNTYTLNGLFGNGVTVKGAGFLLNNEMDDFAARPGEANTYGLIQGEQNAIAGGKRPLSSMTPTIVLKDGKPFLVAGSPGGPTIINTVLQILVDVIDHGMTAEQAVAAPRVHHQWLPDQITIEPDGLDDSVLEGLRARGHRLAERKLYWTQDSTASARKLGDAAVILIDPATGMRHGAADPRDPGAAVVGTTSLDCECD